LGEQTTDVERRKRFLDAACSNLGFCLPPKAQEALKESSDLSPKEFIRAVIAAEGIDPVHLESYEHFGPLMPLYQEHISDT
jgi:hypothetical protein